MKYRQFGKSDIQVSEIGFGTWAMGGNMWGKTDDKVSLEALKTSLDLGLNFIDTANAYGNKGHSEKLIGQFVREQGVRDKVFIATKVPPKDYHWPAKADSQVQDIFPGSWIREITEYSLRNLGIDCIDLQQLHVWASGWMNQGDWLDELQKLKQEGKIRFFGISINDHQPDTALEVVQSGVIDSVQVIYNIFDQSPEEDLLPLCREHHVAVIARVPFDEGGLTGKLTPDTKFEKKDWRRLYFKEDRLKQTCERVEELKIFLDEDTKTIPDLALKYCLAHPAVTTVIPGMRRVEHVHTNCAVSDQPGLTEATITNLKEHAWLRNFYPDWD